MKQISVKDREVQTIQQNAVQAISALENAAQINRTPGAESQTSISPPFTGGNLLIGLALASPGDNTINHNLGRLPKVWILSGQDTNATVWSTGMTSTQLVLQCSAACTVAVWVA